VPQIILEPDSLHEANRRFEQPPLRQSVFLNSVPKSGSHLLRNIVRMFVPVEQQYTAQFIQWGNLREHRGAFNPGRPMLSWGHLFFSDASAIETAPARKILLVRDPYDWVIARARFFISDAFRGNLDHLRDGKLTVEQLLNLMIVGIHQKAPALYDIYLNNAASWIGTGIHVVRYEDLVFNLKHIDTKESANFFSGLLDACGIDMPEDWRERVITGSDKQQSGTAREKLGVGIELPDQLPAAQKQLVEVVAPGMRALLGYA
jgi:hypothetical protein